MPTSLNVFVPADLDPDIVKLDSSDEVDEYGFSKLTHSTSENNISKSETSWIQNPTHIIKAVTGMGRGSLGASFIPLDWLVGVFGV